ncbi:MAG: CocE/NonD family hydrolase [Promethearchaeia archaeon]
MINWIVFMFALLGFILPDFFDLNFMFAVNLPLILISRGLYISAFYLNYVKFTERRSENYQNPLLSKKEILYFACKNTFIIILGFFHFYLAVFFAAYSLMIVGVYDQNIGKRENMKKNYEIPGKLIYYLSPIVLAIFIFLIGDLLAFIPLFFAILLFFFWGENYANLTLEGLERRYNQRLINKIPLFIQIWIMALLIIPVMILVIGIQISGLEFFQYAFLTYIVVLIVFGGVLFEYFLLRKLRKFRGTKFHKLTETSPNILKFFIIAFIIVVPMIFLTGVSVYSSNEVRKETIMIEMSDGTKLATDIYYSPLAWNHITNEPEPAPVILVRTPYGKEGVSSLYYSLYTSQGYHVVIQDFRGTHDSEGSNDFLLFTKAHQDAPETISWIRNKDWCNGKIGSAGISALCITQYMYAGTNPEGLESQSLWFGTPDLIRDAILEGSFHYGLINYWMRGVAPDNWRYQMDLIYDTLNNVSELDKEYAKSVTLEKAPNTYGNVTVPALHVGGWYDHFLKGTIRGYMGYDDLGGEGARGKQKMILGPWIHGMVFSREQGELTYPESANALSMILDWEQEIFDEALTDKDHGDIWDENRVAYYLMGDPNDPKANYWKFADDWPLDYNSQPWYFGVDGDGEHVVVKDTGDLVAENLSYLYDPRDPIDTRGGNNEPGFTEKGAGPFDQRPVEVKDDEDWNEKDAELRDDLLLFQSEKFDKPYTIEGNLKAKLNVKTNRNDTDFMVKLVDVYPDGRRMLIIDSALTMRFWNMTSWNMTQSGHNFWDIGSNVTPEITPIVPGKEYEICIDLAASAYRFDEGHRIGITIQSSNWDRFIVNSNTGGPLTEHFSESEIANNTLITGPEKSCIYLPEPIK